MSDEERETTWEACPPGVLQSLSRRLSAEKRRQNTAKIAQTGGWGLLVAAVATYFAGLAISGRSLPTPGGITCQECMSNFVAYQSHLVGQAEMEPASARQLKAHLAGCAECRAKFTEQYPGLLDVKAALDFDAPLIWVLAQGN